MKKLLLTALCIPFLCASLYAEGNREVVPQGSQPAVRNVGGNPNRDSNGGVKNQESSNGSVSHQQAPASSSVGPAPERVVAPSRPGPDPYVGGPGRPRPMDPPPPPRHRYYYGHYYYADPYYYPQTTVIVYENRDNEVVYYTAEVPDTIRLINQFPVKRELGIVGSFGPYIMSSNREGYDFGGFLASAGLTYQIPINDHSLAFVIGAICSYRTATQTFDIYQDGYRVGNTKYTFEHLGIDVPLMIRLRGTGSRLSFDFGGKILFDVHDQLITKEGSKKKYYHLSDDRDLANFGLAIAFNIDLNSFMAFNIGTDFVFDDTYSSSNVLPEVDRAIDFAESELTFGITFKLF